MYNKKPMNQQASTPMETEALAYNVPAFHSIFYDTSFIKRENSFKNLDTLDTY